MKTLVSKGGAAVVALALLVCAGAPAFAHDRHKKRAQEASAAETAAKELPTAVATLPLAPTDAPEAKPHDHGHHDATEASHPGETLEPAMESNVPRPLAWLGKFHPPVTHFPIALLTAAALAELLFMRTGAAAYRHAVLFCVRFGAAAALLAATLGWFFAGFRIFDEEWVMTAHRWAGTCVALFAAALLYLLERTEAPSAPDTASRSRFRLVLFTSAGSVGATGFLGGALLYGLDHYAW